LHRIGININLFIYSDSGQLDWSIWVDQITNFTLDYEDFLKPGKLITNLDMEVKDGIQARENRKKIWTKLRLQIIIVISIFISEYRTPIL